MANNPNEASNNNEEPAAASIGGGQGTVPAWSDPDIVLSSPAGIAAVTPKDAILVSGSSASFIAGQDINGVYTECQVTAVRCGISLFTYGKATNPDKPNQETGIAMHAASGKVSMQAQSDSVSLIADKQVTIASTHESVTLAAKLKLLLSAGGSGIEMGDGNITLFSAGKIEFKSSLKTLTGPMSSSYQLPVLPVYDIKPTPERKLDSSFAYDQFKAAAMRCTKAEFIALVVPIFGFDIPAKTYLKLYDGLRNGAIPKPIIRLMTGGHFPASFDNDTKEIHVHWIAADRAASEREASWQLLTALLHEFGHYIDAVLRHDLADKNADGISTLADDAPGDEGAKFAYEIAFFDFEGSNDATYATYTSPDYSGPLKVDYRAARQAIRISQSEEAQRSEGKNGSKEHFSAGRGEHYKEHPDTSFGHASIEDALITADQTMFSPPDVRRQIYFGNWLRDFSQILDPKIVRKPSAPKDITKYLSRDALTKIVDVLAEDEFVKKSSDKTLFNVTSQKLGVYRPTEHIDNPTNNDPAAPDPKSIDADFESLPTKDYLAVNPQTSMKRYITASSAYMQSELYLAAQAGANANGYRHFGAALHVLEDYFAHSNFAELSLRKVGHKKVLAWTSPAVGKHSLPVVTGMFGSEDVVASTAGLIADSIFKVKWKFEAIKPGERNKGDRLMIIILGEHSDPSYLKLFKEYLWARDQFAKMPGSTAVQWLMHYTMGTVGNIYNFVYNSLLHLMGNSVSDEQVLRSGDPNTNGSTNPSHSQLAKDHDNHPFHTLAVLLAKHAVKEVGAAMAARWSGNANAHPDSTAAAFLVHPMDCSWQDKIVSDWAKAHPQAVRRGESSTEWEALRKEHEKEVRDAVNKVGQASKSTWDYINDNFETIFGSKNQVKK